MQESVINVAPGIPYMFLTQCVKCHVQARAKALEMQRKEELNCAYGQGEEILRKLLISEMAFEIALRVESQFIRSGEKVFQGSTQRIRKGSAGNGMQIGKGSGNAKDKVVKLGQGIIVKSLQTGYEVFASGSTKELTKEESCHLFQVPGDRPDLMRNMLFLTLTFTSWFFSFSLICLRSLQIYIVLCFSTWLA